MITFWFPFEDIDTLPKILKSPLQKQFWGVSVSPYYFSKIYFDVRSRIFLM